MKLSAIERRARAAAETRDAGVSAARKRAEGIVHTPAELARFVARGADDLLRTELGLRAGLADRALALIDPACGPGAFLAAAVSVAGGPGRAPRCVYAVDRDARAIELARATLLPELTRAGWPCELSQRDTLHELRPHELAALAPVACVIGNPPWVGAAQPAPAPWLERLLDDFRRESDGTRVQERKLGVLADAYVRFVRFGCEVVRLAERGGVLAFVTNASFLDGPVQRAMRAALRRFFDPLYVLDLGGNALIGRGGGARDENVFGVRPAVVVWFGVRRARHDEQKLATVHYLRRRGSRAEKLAWLAEARLASAGFLPLALDARYQRFVPTKRTDAAYSSWPSLADAMPFHREGIQTNRDAVVLDADRARLIARLDAFAAGKRWPELAPAWERLPHYDPAQALARVRAVLERDPDGKRGELVRALAYRPHDTRWFAAIAPLCHRPRPALLRAMAHSQLALVTVRKDRGERPWAHFGAAEHPIDNCFLSTRSSCRARAFPTHDPEGRENLAPQVARLFAERVGREISSLEFCHYALAVLATPSYRARYDEALRIDYPRVPPPSDGKQFEDFCATGAELAKTLCAPHFKASESQIIERVVARLRAPW